MNHFIAEKQRIISSMRQIDTELAGLKRSYPGRAGLVRQKNMLLNELMAVKRRAAEQFVATERNDETITDHALVRWLQRKHGIDTDRLKRLMLNDALKAAISSNQNYWSDGDVVFVIREDVVRTVIPVCDLSNIAA